MTRPSFDNILIRHHLTLKRINHVVDSESAILALDDPAIYAGILPLFEDRVSGLTL